MATTAIGFIPLRKDSKGIPNKNKKKMLGRPLFTWVLTEALFSELDKVFVFTDDPEIISYVNTHFQWSSKVHCMERDAENATDTASTEAAMLEFCSKTTTEFDIFCLLQATSPLTKRDDINKALQRLKSDALDAVLSVVKTHRFTWSEDGKPLNYDIFDRPRRQDFEGLRIENGAIYATWKKALLSSKNRLSGSIGTIEMNENTLVEIDTETDWSIAEQLLADASKSQKGMGRIDYLLLDVDGVFTDGTVVFNKEGEFSKKFDMRDGMGLEILRQHQVQVLVMTSEDSQVVRKRMEKLKIPDIYLNAKDKYSLLEHVCAEKGIRPQQIAYMGDDVNDLSNMVRVGWSICPANATTTIRHHADIILGQPSGAGAIRSACEFVLNYNKRFNDL